MDSKLRCILLVDDNKFDSYFHQKVIKKRNIAEVVVVMDSGSDAIEYLKKTPVGDVNYPDLILLDINMPGMSGWDVLEEYQKLANQNNSTKIFMLTTSINPDDETTAKSHKQVFEFIIKPLNIDTLVDRINANF